MLDSDGYAELLARKPFLYHCAWDATAERVESILANGLERTYTNYSGFWASRPGHVYMTTSHKQKVVPPRDGKKPWVLLRVSTARLERRLIDPDEDHFLTHNWTGGETSARAERICRETGLPFPPSQWVWEWARYLKVPFCSLGEWAEGVGLGAHPAQTRFSARLGRVSYAGVIPPDALQIVERSPL